jgi:hypothetical protein
VHVLFGSAAGLAAAGSQFISQNTPGVPDDSEAGDFFGRRLSAGDFNGDGSADLVVAVQEGLVAAPSGGAIHIFYGGAAPITVAGSQLLHQNISGIADTAEPNDLWGVPLAVGDFNGDAHDDLAVGCVFEDVGANADAGCVTVLYGSATQLQPAGSLFLSENTVGVPGSAESNDFFGDVLLATDTNGDGRDDLLVAAEGDTVGASANAGAIFWFPGSPAGLQPGASRMVHQDTPGVPDNAEPNDFFGLGLATGDFDGDGLAEVVIATPDEGLGSSTSAGCVTILAGAVPAPSGVGSLFVSQNTPGVPDAAESDDRFGDGLVLPR